MLIPVNFMESQNGVKCVDSASCEKQIEQALVNHRKMQSELTKISGEVILCKLL